MNKRRIKQIAKTIITISIMIWAIESGNFLYFIFGIFLYGIFIKRDLYKDQISTWKSLIKTQWEMPNKKINSKKK